MNNYLLAIGWWNFTGSVFMLFFLNEKFGKKVLNEWTKIFITEFKLDYWSKLWMVWATGLNIFFGLMNIYAAEWNLARLGYFIIYFDFFAYFVFIMLAIWGWRSKRLGEGVYSVFLIFGGWISWGVYVILTDNSL